jgi:predicted RNase H-like nuclease (RuvC/YqgF family)
LRGAVRCDQGERGLSNCRREIVMNRFFKAMVISGMLLIWACSQTTKQPPPPQAATTTRADEPQVKDRTRSQEIKETVETLAAMVETLQAECERKQSKETYLNVKTVS